MSNILNNQSIINSNFQYVNTLLNARPAPCTSVVKVGCAITADGDGNTTVPGKLAIGNTVLGTQILKPSTNPPAGSTYLYAKLGTDLWCALAPDGTETCLGGSGSMTWPATPGAAVCTGTPCNAWGSSVTLGTAATANTGTSGANVPLLSTANTWSLLQSFSGGISTGATAPAVTAGTGGVLAGAEGTAPSVCPASAVDCLYWDSTQHGPMLSRNNGSYLPIPQAPASTTSGHAVLFNATNGGLLSDAGAAPALATNFIAGAGALTGPASPLTIGTIASHAAGDYATSTAFVAGAGALTGPTSPLTIGTAASHSFIYAGTVALNATNLGTASLGANSCTTPYAATATGVASTDAVIITANANISGITGYGAATADGLALYWYPGSGVINWVACNKTGTTIAISNSTYPTINQLVLR